MLRVKDQYLGKDFHGYHIVAQLARHAGKHVYVAHRQTSTDEVVIIKVFTALKLSSQQRQTDFLQEARFLASVKHAHLLPILAIGIENGHPYSIMPYVARGSLRQRMQRATPATLGTDERRKIIMQIGEALTTLHGQNIVHSNLKPENIFFTSKEGVIFADPDLATLNDELAEANTYVVTSVYRAPEQTAGTVTQKSDQYALGCIAYELLTGVIPWTLLHSAGKQEERSDVVVAARPVPKQVQQVLLKATATSPANRYPTVAGLLHAFEAAFLSVGARKQELSEEKLVRLLSPEEVTIITPIVLPGVEHTDVAVRPTKSALATPAFVEQSRRKYNTAAFWILLILLAFILIMTLALAPFVRNHQAQIRYRSVVPITSTRIVGKPIKIATPPVTSSSQVSPVVQPTAKGTVGAGATVSPKQSPTTTSTASVPTPAPTTPTLSPPEVPALLTGSYTIAPVSVNLTNEGTVDWAKWGGGYVGNYSIRKSGVTPLISTFALIGNTPFDYFGSNPTNYSWYDGTSITSFRGSTSGIVTYSDGDGFQLNVAASTTTRTLRLYMSIGDTRCNFSASLSGNNSLSYADTSFYNPTGNSLVGVYTLTFRASSNNQTLTIAYTQMNSIGAGYITIQAATLQ